MYGPEEWLPTTEPGLTASFTFLLQPLFSKTVPGFWGNSHFRENFGALSPGGDAPNTCNCLIFKHNYLMRYIQYTQYPIVFIDVLLQEKTVKIGVNKLL